MLVLNIQHKLIWGTIKINEVNTFLYKKDFFLKCLKKKKLRNTITTKNRFM